MAESVSSFVKNHKVALIILGVSVLIYLVYDYFTASASSNSAQYTTDAADQAALTDQLAALQAGSSGGTPGTSGGSTGDSTGGSAVGYTGENIPVTTQSPGTAATDAANT